jgi:hypothetical protein
VNFTPADTTDYTSATATTTITVAENGSKAESPPGAGRTTAHTSPLWHWSWWGPAVSRP